jgi:DNA replication protein DnaC
VELGRNDCGKPSRWANWPTDRRCLDCARKDLIARLPYAVGFTLDSFPRETPELDRAWRAVSAWLDHRLDPDVEDERNLYLYGPSGTGKTGLAFACLMAELDDNGSPDFLNVPEWLTVRKRGFEAARRADLGEYDLDLPPDPYPRLDDVGLLALDDVDATRLTPWALEEVAGLVQTRYNQLGPRHTIVTTNYSPADLAERLSTRRDPHAGERIVSRLIEDAVVVEFEGVNLRLPYTSADDVRRIVEGDE